MQDQFSLGLTGCLLVMAAVTQPFFVANAASSGTKPVTLPFILPPALKAQMP